MLIAFNKPYGVLSRFTPEPGSKHTTLANYGFPLDVYPVGRLDADSEGLLLLSDEAGLPGELLHPVQGHRRTYLVQVEGAATEAALAALRNGVVIKGERTQRCRATLLHEMPNIEPRTPPIRTRLTVPTSWITLELTEGKNRQVRRMTAAVGLPTLRLIRTCIGDFTLDGIAPGTWRTISATERSLLFRKA